MMGLKMLSYVDKRLRQASDKMDIPFCVYAIIFVGYLQQLPPIGDTCLYKNYGSPDTLKCYSIHKNFILHEIRHHAGEEEKNQILQ